jgi:hypothetical protein
MYRTCLYCHTDLGVNDDIAACPVGRRLAFDPAKGRLWVVCTHCGRWNLTPLEERWEAIEQCERLYRDSWQRYSVENIGLANTRSRLELVRIGTALFPEIASWRYGARLQRWARDPGDAGGLWRRTARYLARRIAGGIARASGLVGLSDATILRLGTFRRGEAILARSVDEHQRRVVIRYSHLGAAELIRPARAEPWRIRVAHDGGVSLLAEQPGILAAGKMLAALNFAAASAAEVRWAIAKLGDAGDPAGFFTRIGTLAMRTSWGRFPDAPADAPAAPAASSEAERLALPLATRSFWGHGGLGSQSQTPLYRLPPEDRLALEMAANEDVERRALAGELAELREAWKEAEEIAAIADDMFVGEALEEFKRQYYIRQAMTTAQELPR